MKRSGLVLPAVPRKASVISCGRPWGRAAPTYQEAPMPRRSAPDRSRVSGAPCLRVYERLGYGSADGSGRSRSGRSSWGRRHPDRPGRQGEEGHPPHAQHGGDIFSNQWLEPTEAVSLQMTNTECPQKNRSQERLTGFRSVYSFYIRYQPSRPGRRPRGGPADTDEFHRWALCVFLMSVNRTFSSPSNPGGLRARSRCQQDELRHTGMRNGACFMVGAHACSFSEWMF